MQIILIEIKKILYRKQFWIIFILLLISVFCDFYMTCKFYYNEPLSTIPSAYYLNIIKKFEGGTSAGLLFNSFLFFLTATIVASDTLYDEKQLGLHNCTFTRIGRGHYVKYKAIAIMTVIFVMIVFMLLVSQFLAICAFPIQGYFTSQITYNELMEPDGNRILSYFESYHPYWNIIIFIGIRGLTGAVTALLAFSVTFVNHAKKYTVLLIPMIIYMVYSTVFSMIASKIKDVHTSNILDTNILIVNGYGNIWMIIGYVLLQAGISILFIIRGLRNDDTLL